MRIAFLYIAEAYQCYHSAATALELASRPGVEVDNFYNDPETPYHLERIRQALGGPALHSERLHRSLPTRTMQSIRILGMFKDMVLWDNRKRLDRYDAIFAVENSVATLRSMGVRRPKLIYTPHGFGDRARGFIPRIAKFDFVLLAGPKTEKRMLSEGLIRPGDYALPGYVKMETAQKLGGAIGPLFAKDRPIVLYNPHKAPELQSWSRFIEPMLSDFEAQDAFNLIVAPHVKMFRRRSATVRQDWEKRSTGRILIDLGSDRSLDTSYSASAAIYIGDVSSQVYEFLAVPRPCIFLNPKKIDWKGDPSFRHWNLGDVVEDPADLMAAVRAAPERHQTIYARRQEELSAATLGDRSPGAARRSADSVIAFLKREGLA